MGRVQDKVCIVTGGALGIGQATAKLLAREGAAVAIIDKLKREGERTAADVRDGGGEAAFFRCDISKEAEVKAAVKDIVARFRRIHVLVNNAGIIGADKPTHEVTEKEWDEVMNVNVKGTFFMTKHAVPHLKKAGGGSIVNLSSVYGIVGGPDMPPYHASKGAIRIMTKTDAALYAKDGIRVNSVHPGEVHTPMMERQAKNEGKSVRQYIESVKKDYPLGHIAQPEDIAYCVLFLASDESRFVTGSELIADGGFTMQ